MKPSIFITLSLVVLLSLGMTLWGCSRASNRPETSSPEEVFNLFTEAVKECSFGNALQLISQDILDSPFGNTYDGLQQRCNNLVSDENCVESCSSTEKNLFERYGYSCTDVCGADCNDRTTVLELSCIFNVRNCPEHTTSFKIIGQEELSENRMKITATRTRDFESSQMEDETKIISVEFVKEEGKWKLNSSLSLFGCGEASGPERLPSLRPPCNADSDCVVRMNNYLKVRACHSADTECANWEEEVETGSPGHAEWPDVEDVIAVCKEGTCDLQFNCSKCEALRQKYGEYCPTNMDGPTTAWLCRTYVKCGCRESACSSANPCEEGHKCYTTEECCVGQENPACPLQMDLCLKRGLKPETIPCPKEDNQCHKHCETAADCPADAPNCLSIPWSNECAIHNLCFP